VSEEVGRSDRYQGARAADVAATAALRLGLPPQLVEWLAEWRNQAIQKRAASLLSAGDTDLIVPAGAALKPLEHARTLRIRSWLDCPTAHHRYAERLLTEELRLQPDFAGTMQFPAPSPRVARGLDSEIELADRLLVLSKFQRRTFEEEGIASSRLHLVPLGVDVELFRPALHTRNDTFTIGFVGQVTQRKGISYLMAAFEALRPHGVRLLVVGRPVGPRRPWLRDGVDHQPPMARSSLPGVYAQMDVFVLPSLIEGFGLTALEAMACGVPVIVSENTFGSDIVVDGENGYVVPIRDADAIVERVRALIEDESLRSLMALNARTTAETYSWEAFGRRVVDLVVGKSDARHVGTKSVTTD
jgi:glycosyltransferase involved in cell wall biosynthesis